MNSEDNDSNAGGEAVFLLNKRSSQEQSTCAKAHSRKRHMQQPSAQLFMEEEKGVKQMPACRDIVFMLFFVFHLLLNVNLSRNDIQYVGTKHLNYTTSHWKLTNLLSLSFYKSNLYCWFEWSFCHNRIGPDSIANDNHCKQIVQITLILTITFSFV